MDFEEILQARRSIRRYTGEAVPIETIEKLLRAAMWAPSAHGRQPWRWVVVTEPEAKDRLARAMGARLRADRLDEELVGRVAVADEPQDGAVAMLAGEAGQLGGLSRIWVGPASEIKPFYLSHLRWLEIGSLIVASACLVLGLLAWSGWLGRRGDGRGCVEPAETFQPFSVFAVATTPAPCYTRRLSGREF